MQEIQEVTTSRVRAKEKKKRSCCTNATPRWHLHTKRWSNWLKVAAEQSWLKLKHVHAVSQLAPAGSPELLLPVSTLQRMWLVRQVSKFQMFSSALVTSWICGINTNDLGTVPPEQSLAFFLPQQSCILHLSVLEANIGLTGWKSHTATLTHGHTHADRLKDWLRKHLWWFQDLWDFPALRCSKTGPSWANNSARKLKGKDKDREDSTCVHCKLPALTSRRLKNTVAAVILGVKLADGPLKV